MLDFNALNSNRNNENTEGIGRYLGTSSASGDARGGFDFSQILSQQLKKNHPISPALDTTLERLENNAVVPGLQVEKVAKEIFTAIEFIQSDAGQLFRSSPTDSDQESDLAQLDRLLNGAKKLFDLEETPYILEQLAVLWETFKAQQSPAFHNVHAYFFHLSVCCSGSRSDHAFLDDGSEEESKTMYSEATQALFVSIVEQLPESTEKEELFAIFERAYAETPPELEFDEWDGTDDVEA